MTKIIKVTPIDTKDLIGFEMDLMGEVSRRVASLQEQVVRQQLEKAGWLSPEASAALRAQVEALTEPLARVRKALADRQINTDVDESELLRTAANILTEDGGIIAHLNSKVEALTKHIRPVYLVATGEVHEGQETYTRHDAPVPMADQEVLFTRPPEPPTRPAVPETEVHEPKCPALDGGDCTCARSDKHDQAFDRSWARFCAKFGDGPDAPYPGMISAFERYYSQSFADKEWRTESAVWAAAWKAAMLAAPQPPVGVTRPAVPERSSEHYDEVRATLTGLRTLCQNISNIELRVGPLGSHARGYTHKITAALRHLELLAAAPQPEVQAAATRWPEYLTRAVDQWFAQNTGLGGCSDSDVSQLAAIFYDLTYEGGRESVDDAIAIVDSFGPGIEGLNDTFARQVILAAEVKRMRARAEALTRPIGRVESAIPGAGGFHVRLAIGVDAPKVGDPVFLRTTGGM